MPIAAHIIKGDCFGHCFPLFIFLIKSTLIKKNSALLENSSDGFMKGTRQGYYQPMRPCKNF